MSTYEKKTWINNETKVNATNMNHIEEGIYTNSVEIEELKNDKQEINYEALTYAELKVLKDNNELTPNKAYRITDYVTKVNGKINNVSDLARSMEHPFDIFVLATSTNTFSEEAFACLHEGDTYFVNSDLSSWKLWYCFENDTDRFEWADIENGKGVIYRMIDEFENDLPYDFKNIQFKRYKITGTTDSRQEAFIGKYYAFIGVHFVTYDNSDFEWFYTCNDIEGNDLSIQNVNNHDYGSCRYVKQLKIGQYLSDEPNYRGCQALNDIVLISPSMIVDLKFGEGSTKNTFVGNEDMTYSYFEEMCRRNIICGELSHNRCQECFQENLIGTGISTDETFHFVRTGRHFENNIIIKMTSTTFKDAAYDNIFANDVAKCTFSSIINNNDYSNLNVLQYCDIQRSYNTKIYGSKKWLFVKVMAFESCEIHVDSLYGSTFGFLQQVKLINSNFSPSTPLNIVNMEFDTMIGSPTIIDFALLLPYNLHGTRSFKKLCCAKINTGSTSNTNKIEYTCENIEDGEKKILGAYSDDNGVTWLPLAQDQEVYNTLEITSEDITVEDDKIVFNSDVAQEIMSMNKRIRVDASITDPTLEQGKFIAVFTPRGITDYSLLQPNTIVYEYSTTNWLLDTYRTTYVEFVWNETTEKLYVDKNTPAHYEDHIVGFDTSFNDGNIRLTENVDMQLSSLNALHINDYNIISTNTPSPSLEFNANSNNELESVVFREDGSSVDFTYTIPKGAKHYVVNELPTTDIDTNGNYYVMTESEDAREYLPTDISNLSQSEYPSTNPNTLRQDPAVNGSDFTKLQVSEAGTNKFRGDFAIKFNIPCAVLITLNPTQPYGSYMYLDVNGVNELLITAGHTYDYARNFNVGETLYVRGECTSILHNLYYKLAIQPYTIDGKIPLSTNVDEYINYENLWFKNGGGTKVVANPTLSGDEPDLEGAEIDGVKYKVGGGSEVHLYNHKFSYIKSGTKVLNIVFEVFNASSTPIQVKNLNREENFMCNGSYGTSVVTYFKTSAENNNDVTLYGINQILGTVTINATDTITQIF